jgi:hypothetical protein
VVFALKTSYVKNYGQPAVKLSQPMPKIPKNSILTRMKDDIYSIIGTDLVFLEEWGGLTRLHAPTRATAPFLSTTLFVSIQYFPSLSLKQDIYLEKRSINFLDRETFFCYL